MKQYVDRLSGEPARRQACRSGVSAVAVEAFVNYAGELLSCAEYPLMDVIKARWSRTWMELFSPKLRIHKRAGRCETPFP